MADNTFARSLHDIGLAGWFGGSLMGTIGLHGAASEVADPRERARVANAGWARWRPVNYGFAAAHLLGAAIITRSNRGRLGSQSGVAAWTGAKAAMTLAALGASVYAAGLGKKMQNAGDVPVEGATQSSNGTPPEVEQAQSRLRVLQWAIPALTGTALVMNARMGEQQRPTAVAEGVVRRLTSR